jgi:hypothetical protein
VSDEVVRGWYPDPTSGACQRWWDGSQWTVSTRPIPGEEDGQTPPALPTDPTTTIPAVSQPPPHPDVVAECSAPGQPAEAAQAWPYAPTTPSSGPTPDLFSDATHQGGGRFDVAGEHSGARRWGAVVAASFSLLVLAGTTVWLASSSLRSEDAAATDELAAGRPTADASAPDEDVRVSNEPVESELAIDPEPDQLAPDPADDATEDDVIVQPSTPDEADESRDSGDTNANEGLEDSAEWAADTDGDAIRLDSASDTEDANGGADSAASGAGGAGSDDSTDAEPAQRTVNLDGQCVVTVDDHVLASGDPIYAWDFPECRWAHIALAPGEERWIVVYTSLNGEEFEAGDALERAAENRVPGNVLWSSHYPSLNPGVWVIFEGPYMTEDAAKAATRRVGGRAYPRILSEDVGDRYCVGSDNCVGETAEEGR